MEEIEERLARVHLLIEAIQANKDKMVSIAVRDTGFTHRECSLEVEVILTRLQGFDEMVPTFARRRPICGPEEEVALVLPYNGSAWLNVAMVSIYLVGNRLRVKFASRGSEIARFTESLYNPIFGDAIRFDYSRGRTFVENAITNPRTPAICLFGTDEYAWKYMDSIKAHQKKFVFEGPGKDPFIVLPGANLEAEREAPTAAVKSFASSSNMAKFSGPFMPRPPEIMISASVRSSLPPASFSMFTTWVCFPSATSTSALSTSAFFEVSGARQSITLGRQEAIWGQEPSDHSYQAKALPAYIGLLALREPPSTFNSVQSVANPAPSLAASRALKSLPSTEAGVRITFGPRLFRISAATGT